MDSNEALPLSRTKNRRLPVPVAGFVADTPRTAARAVPARQHRATAARRTWSLNCCQRSLGCRPLACRRGNCPRHWSTCSIKTPSHPSSDLVKRASTGPESKQTAIVTDTGLVEALKESLESPSGVLFPYRNIATGTTDTEGIRNGPDHLLDRRSEHVPGGLGQSRPRSHASWAVSASAPWDGSWSG